MLSHIIFIFAGQWPLVLPAIRERPGRIREGGIEPPALTDISRIPSPLGYSRLTGFLPFLHYFSCCFSHYAVFKNRIVLPPIYTPLFYFLSSSSSRTKPPRTFEVPLITAVCRRWWKVVSWKKKPNYRFWTRTRNTGVKFLYVAITLTGISARAVIYIKERRFIEAKSWLPHGRINKNVIFIPLYIEYSSQIPVGTLQSSFHHA